MRFIKSKAAFLFTRKAATLLSAMIFCIAVASSTFRKTEGPAMPKINLEKENKDSIASVKAFMDVYTVLMSPRCMNCHPAGDTPLQGDDSHLHTMAPKRGADGKGVLAMKCTNCHQPENTPGLHTPPGNPNWHLPPSDMKMVFQGKTPHELAKQLVDKNLNGHKDMKQLLDHAHDSLVLSGWNPGEGRTLPPMSHKDFAKAWTTWIKKGAYAPAASNH